MPREGRRFVIRATSQRWAVNGIENIGPSPTGGDRAAPPIAIAVGLEAEIARGGARAHLDPGEARLLPAGAHAADPEGGRPGTAAILGKPGVAAAGTANLQRGTDIAAADPVAGARGSMGPRPARSSLRRPRSPRKVRPTVTAPCSPAVQLLRVWACSPPPLA